MVEEIVRKGPINRWSHDAENLYLAKKAGIQIAEVPLLWHNGTETKVRVMKDVVQSFIALLAIRVRHG
jgi:hypothetical protein